MPKKLKTVKELVQDLRDLINDNAHLDEKEVLEALCNEAEGWEMRLDELEG
jgi:hypothetical protein